MSLRPLGLVLALLCAAPALLLADPPTIVSADDFECGDVGLWVSPAPAATGDDCSDPIPIAIVNPNPPDFDPPVQGAFSGRHTDYGTTCPPDLPAGGLREVVYSFTIPGSNFLSHVGLTVQVAPAKADVDVAVYVVRASDCGVSLPACAGSDLGGPGVNEQVVYYNDDMAPQAVFVVVESASRSACGGGFSIVRLTTGT